MFPTAKILRRLSYQSRIFKNVNYGNLQKPFRNIHFNIKLHQKMFLERENKYAYDIMKNKGYSIDFYNATSNKNMVCTKEHFEEILHEDWSKKKPNQMIEAFSVLGSYSSDNGLCISNNIFDSFIDMFTDNICNTTDEELKLIFYYLLKWPETESVRTRNFIEVWVALDDECINRIKGWSFDEMLSFVALFYMLNVTRVSDFSIKCMQKMASKAKQLTSSQLVQAMFFIGIIRKSPFDMHNLEIQLNEQFTEFNIDELAIMSMGFFKSKTPIRNMELISKVIMEIIKHSKDINEISLAALLKIVRYSAKADPEGNIYKLLDALRSEVPRLSLMCNVHLALLGTATQTLHKECLIDIANMANNNINKARLKDMERLAFTFGNYNLIGQTIETFLKKVVDELRNPERLPETERHGRSFACCIGYLGILGIYPVDLMNNVLSPKFLNKIYGKQVMSYGREILSVNNIAKIFCPDASMNRLTDKAAIILAKKYTEYVPSETYKKQYNLSERMFIDVFTILKELRGGENFVKGDHILPHHQKGDIIICNDQNGAPMDISQYFKTADFGTLRRPPNDNIWIALVISGRNTTIRNTHIAIGPFQAKVRELEVLGYCPVLVPWSKYSTLDTKEVKADYLKGLIDEAVGNKCGRKIKTT